MKKLFTIFMIMVMVFTNIPMTTEAKTKVSITVTNKSTGKKISKKLSLKKGQKVQLTVKYGKKTVTKKAKYKTSAKTVVTVSKKGKLTAKSAGTCTVKITYKKKTKKVKVTVTDTTAKKPFIETPEDEEDQSTDVSKTQPTQTKTITQYVEDCKLEVNPHSECTHEWQPYFSSDTYIPYANLYTMYKDHLFLSELSCRKCSTYAVTTPIPITEALNYSNEDLNKTILYYMDNRMLNECNAPKHKCQGVQQFTAIYKNDILYLDIFTRCSICHDYIFNVSYN